MIAPPFKPPRKNGPASFNAAVRRRIRAAAARGAAAARRYFKRGTR